MGILAGSKFRKRQDSLFSTLEFKGLELSWLSFTAATGIKKYYNFDTAASTFAKQLTSRDLQTYRFGVKYNKYWFNSLDNKYIFASIGLSYGRDNNSSLQTTTSVSEESVYKNSAGDTTRKISNKYNAYTEPLIETRKWGLSLDFYFLFGERTSGFHIAPAFYKPVYEKNYMDLDAGYLVSFANEKKDKPTINVEAYYRFNDLYNTRNSGIEFWKRNEIGIRLGLPFSLLIK